MAILSTAFGVGQPALGHINNQFYYASMNRMFAEKTLISKVQKMYHKTLHAILETYEKSYEDLVLMNDNISIHQNSLHFLATEIFNKFSIFNFINNLNPQFMWNCFSFKLILYELRKGNVIYFPPVPSTWHRTIFYSLEVY